MLKYFKKQTDVETDDHALCDEVFLEEDRTDEVFAKQSRLSMNINGILNENNCLRYFAQYLEKTNSLSLLHFYLDIENFRTSAKASQLHDEEHKLSKRILSEGGNSSINSENRTTEAVEISKETNEGTYRNSNVPELKTICDISMRKPITDDEKSQICAQTNKKLTEKIIDEESKVPSSKKEFTKGSKNIDCASFSDAINIYEKYLTPSSTEFVELPIAILECISLSLCSQSDPANTKLEKPLLLVSSKSFDEASEYIINIFETEYLNAFLQSSFYFEYCVELIANTTLTISDVLNSETLLFYFMEFLEQDGQRNCLDFWVAAINYRKHYTNLWDNSEVSKKEAQTDAMIIYEKYFSLQSETRLWMANKIRSNVEERICKESSEVRDIGHCFDLPLRVVSSFLEKKYLKSFIESSLFANFVKELHSKIPKDKMKQPTSSVKCKHRKSMSDCTDKNSSEIRRNFVARVQQEHSTLLATDGGSSGSSSYERRGTSSHLINDQNWQTIDCEQSHNRNSNGARGLSFGRVNPLGRYERDFDTVDAISTKNWSLASGGSKLKNAVRKLVNLPEDNVQEDIAWQIAEMIVKDVTDITMNKNNT